MILYIEKRPTLFSADQAFSPHMWIHLWKVLKEQVYIVLVYIFLFPPHFFAQKLMCLPVHKMPDIMTT